jgi:glycosyltransferase involved in cell wall biosynthesis
LSSADVVVVLPPKEGFSPGAVGAIGLLVHRLVRGGAGGVVLGRRGAAAPFADVDFRAVRLGWGFSNAARYARGVADAVRTLRPGLIEVHNWPEVALRLVRTGVPVTLILNNDPQSMRGSKTAAERTVLLQRLARVATSSAWLRGRLLDGVVAPAHDPVVLHNCIDLPPPPPTRREKLIVFAGRMVRDKGADTFVAACALALPGLPGWRAEMIGADRFRPDSPETPFLRSLRPRAEAACVVLRGHQPNDVVLDAMRRAAIVAVPSRWAEPFGLVAVEAMAQGAALVCSDRGGLPEVAGDTALYANPDDARSLADAFVALAGDPARCAAMAAAGRLRAEGFGTPAAVERLLAFRAGVTAAAPARAS